MSASQHPPDTGNHAIGLIIEDNQIIVRFQHAITYLKLDPQNAMEIAGALLKMGMEIKTGKMLPNDVAQKLLADTQRDIKIDQARELLINRMILMLRGFEDSNRSLEWRARQVVDTILVEVT